MRVSAGLCLRVGRLLALEADALSALLDRLRSVNDDLAQCAAGARRIAGGSDLACLLEELLRYE